ncbi:MAG: TIGR02147 family protein [bacterium]|nr:TIGR02147 family protein [bacterium]MBU1918989.1 TIGR02147 family protein [bacterium]
MKNALFTYTDYRQFLKDYYQDQKDNNPKFSFRFFAKMGGLSSSAYLKVVMDGKRNLSPAAINKFTKAMKLNKKEASYFENLVFFNQAKTDSDKDLYFERMLVLKPKVAFHGIEKDQFEYYTQKHFVIIREMVALPHFKEDHEWIAARLKFRINASQAKHAIDVLLRLGLLDRDEEGRLQQALSSLSTQPEVASLEVFNFHRAMLREAAESMLNVPKQLRDITSLTIPMPTETLPEIKQYLHKVKEEIVNMIGNSGKEFHEVYQLNMQLFPVTKTGEKKK